MSLDYGYSSTTSSPDADLPCSTFDGSHLQWKAFRQQVLAPHRIRIIESVPKDRLPDRLLAMIEAGSQNVSQFEAQKKSFREQVDCGRGFGPSPLFPPNLLPSIDDESRLARCMVPTFAREALPQRALNQMGPLYELSVPRSGLGCGFSKNALTPEEANVIPIHLVTTGTVVHYNTGYISPGAELYCPYLTFERAQGNKKHRLEEANNRCAVGGAWCVSALHMLYTQAWAGQMMPELPIAFSCSIDNAFALINLHWIDHGQAYCMAHLCKFDLTNDEHFTKFLVWMDSINEWALSHLLPLIKRALERVHSQETTPPATPRILTRLSLTTDLRKDDRLIQSLRTTFDNIPWRFEDDEFTPVSSSTASWGSPMIDDITFTYPPISKKENVGRSTNLKSLDFMSPEPAQQVSPPPAYAHNPELAWQRRFNHAMDEIRDLQRQVREVTADLTGSNSSLQTELTVMKTTISSILRKETLNTRNRSLSTGMQDSLSHYQNTHRQFFMSDAKPSPLCFDQQPALSIVCQTIDTSVASSFIEMHNAKPVSPIKLLSPNPISPAMPSPTFSIKSEASIVMISPPPPQVSALWKCATIMLSGHIAASLIPLTIVRVLILGCIADFCILVFASPHYPSFAAYLSSWFHTGCD